MAPPPDASSHLDPVAPEAGPHAVLDGREAGWRGRVASAVQEDRRYRWWVLATVLAGVFANTSTFTVFAVSLPDVASQFGTTQATMAWVVTGPMLTYALCMPLLGKVGDLHGPRRTYLAGFAGFTVVTGLTALAPTATALIAARVAAAVMGSATGPASMALIMKAFDTQERAKAMGWFTLVAAGAPVIGLVAGGPVVDAIGWRWLFVVQVPLCAAALGVAFVILKEAPPAHRAPIDGAGAVSFALAIGGALFALSLSDRSGWLSGPVLAPAAVAAAGAVAFVTIERRASYPLLPLELLGRRNFVWPIAAQAGAHFAYMGGFLVAPFLLRELFAQSVAQASLVMLCRPLSFSLCSPIGGYLAAQLGERRCAVLGTGSVVASMAIFAMGSVSGSIALVVAALVLSGAGLGIAMPSLASSVANSVDDDSQATAAAAQQMFTQVGAVAGMQVLLGMLGDATAPSSFAAVYVVGGLVAVPAVVAATLVRPLDRPRSLVAPATA